MTAVAEPIVNPVPVNSTLLGAAVTAVQGAFTMCGLTAPDGATRDLVTGIS